VLDHQAVTQALLARDSGTAAAAMLEHIERGKAATIDHLRAIGAPES
jgi:DNA-binding GntR family transcriptional regulator